MERQRRKTPYSITNSTENSSGRLHRPCIGRVLGLPEANIGTSSRYLSLSSREGSNLHPAALQQDTAGSLKRGMPTFTIDSFDGMTLQRKIFLCPSTPSGKNDTLEMGHQATDTPAAVQETWKHMTPDTPYDTRATTLLDARKFDYASSVLILGLYQRRLPLFLQDF